MGADDEVDDDASVAVPFPGPTWPAVADAAVVEFEELVDEESAAHTTFVPDMVMPVAVAVAVAVAVMVSFMQVMTLTGVILTVEAAVVEEPVTGLIEIDYIFSISHYPCRTLKNSVLTGAGVVTAEICVAYMARIYTELEPHHTAGEFSP